MKNLHTEPADGVLVKAAQTDRDAFDALYRRYVTRVYRYCYAHTGTHADAEDLTAQTFLAALEGLPRYRGRGPFAAWLFGIARRKCTDHHRSQYAKRSESLEMANPLPDPSAPDPEQNAYRNDMLDCVRHALPHLSPDRREALTLRFWGGLRGREVAAVMRRSEGAVKMLLSRAVADLRRRCLDEEETE
ncbi:MAG: RNA polymerase sigma factor [Chloroflexota bacterium]|nr:RNA polymerase sigma factor [Chloroflexota bacterium]